MIPKISIVGRPNVGKSSLMNLLANRRISIVDPTAGVTRDRVSSVVDLPAGLTTDQFRQIELIDTGGYGIEDVQDLTAHVERQIAYAIAESVLILFVIDAQTGVASLDHKVARLLRQSNPAAPVVMVANKVDDTRYEADAFEAAGLGFGVPVAVSATTGRGKSELLEAVLANLDAGLVAAGTPDDQEPAALIAIAGKRNAGKSTLVNALAGEPRVIVSPIEGTTRDSIDVRFELDGKTFVAIDTAGVRKVKSLAGDIEFYSYHRTLRSVRRADVVLLLIDASVPISQVDKQLANEVLKHHKPCVIVLNKWDLVGEQYTQDEYMAYLDGALKGLSFAPVAFVSAKEADGLRETVDMAMNLYEQAGHRVTTSQLNQALEAILAKHTPASKLGKRPKIYYATQLDVHPPTVALFVNDTALFDPSYQRFLINRLREVLPFAEVPINLVVRGKKSIPLSARLIAEPAGR